MYEVSCYPGDGGCRLGAGWGLAASWLTCVHYARITVTSTRSLGGATERRHNLQRNSQIRSPRLFYITTQMFDLRLLSLRNFF